MTDAFQDNCSNDRTIESLADSLRPKNDLIQYYRQQFETDFLELQKQDSSTGRLMYVFLRRTLGNFHLQGSYNEAYVLNEAYIRGIKCIEKGEQIFHPSAWLRKTAYNIIRELHRDHQKCTKLDETIAESLSTFSVAEELTTNLIILRLAFQMLDPKDQRLLNLKIVEGLAWKNISEILRRYGERDCSEAGLRKRKERALIRLRKKFHMLKPALDGWDEP